MSEEKKRQINPLEGVKGKDVGSFYWKTLGGALSLFGNLFTGKVPYSKADISGTDDPIVPRPCLFAKPPKPTKRGETKEDKQIETYISAQ
eukprot:CAMPEP_0118932454 /NCGR_PEP_ID=MMETSP1169-20130426/10274_1 /TAXON_ID=36882 /ORGANISM="Pyramimonas obovata, Strain CCMP722" /LENGTH=89 /DNA_ID=CAMNT_0006875117 /DNA_START=111 /DNA_END=380 /DNA_ORIENTATION=+